MKIAIASSGLGHVARGMEAWAETLAKQLDRKGIDVTLFRGAGPQKNNYDIILPTFKRNNWPAKFIAKLTSKGGWRIGLGAPHAVESFFFGIQLIFYLKKNYDLAHIQQGSLAFFLSMMQRLGLLKIPFIFANGQKASAGVLRRFQYIQFLSPFDKDEAISNHNEKLRQFVIPNFVDTHFYSPGNKRETRRELGLPEDCLIVLTVGLIDKSVKRMDYFICEAQKFMNITDKKIKFIIAGSNTTDTPVIQKLGSELLGDKLDIYQNLNSNEMLKLYRSADLFVLCSFREAFGLAIAEAMACGLPVICHDFPIMKWVVGNGGECINLSHDGALVNMLKKYCDDPGLRVKTGMLGRERVQANYAADIVVNQVVDMYHSILSKKS